MHSMHAATMCTRTTHWSSHQLQLAVLRGATAGLGGGVTKRLIARAL
jgi:hypothetical protein